MHKKRIVSETMPDGIELSITEDFDQFPEGPSYSFLIEDRNNSDGWNVSVKCKSLAELCVLRDKLAALFAEFFGEGGE